MTPTDPAHSQAPKADGAGSGRADSPTAARSAATSSFPGEGVAASSSAQSRVDTDPAVLTLDGEFRIEDLPARLAARILVNPVTGCWEWRGAKSDDGYGRVKHDGKRVRVHRLVYTLLVGPIPEELTLDHVKAWGCQSRACCWPAHLEPLPGPDNTRRGGCAQKTHCPKGHLYDETNTYITSQGRRKCRTCRRARSEGRKEGGRTRIELRRGIAEAALHMAAEDGATLSSWITALVTAEIERRAARQAEVVHD